MINIDLNDLNIEAETKFSIDIKEFMQNKSLDYSKYKKILNTTLEIYKKIKNSDLNESFITKESIGKYFGIYSALELFHESIVNEPKIYSFNISTESSAFSKERMLAHSLNKELIRFIDTNNNEDVFYSYLKNYAKSRLDNIESNFLIKVNYNNKTINYPDLEYKILYDKEDNNLEYIGNKDAFNQVMSSMIVLSYYDPVLKKNTLLDYFNFPKIITLIGPPGTGKTLLINKATSYLRKISKKQVDVLRVDADTKSEYYSVSSRNLKRTLTKAFNPDFFGLVVMEEIDTKIFSRSSISDKDSNELSFTGTFLETIDSGIKYYGNFLIFATSNKNLDKDNALKRRLSENIIYVPGLQTYEEYKQMYSSKLSKTLNKFIFIKNWDKIIDISKKSKFQGGDIKNICLNIEKRLYQSIEPGLNNDLIKKELYKNRLTEKEVIEEIQRFNYVNNLLKKNNISK